MSKFIKLYIILSALLIYKKVVKSKIKKFGWKCINTTIKALFLAFLTLSFVPTSTFGAIGTKINLPYYYYYYVEVEAGDMDLIFWSFTSTGNKIEAYLMDSRSFDAYRLWPSKLFLYGLGDKLAGYSYQASGYFRPPYQDTWYFIFFNGGSTNATAAVEMTVYNSIAFYVFVPLVIVVVSAVVAIGVIKYYYPKLKAKKKAEPAVTWEKVQPPVQAAPQVQQELVSKPMYCPMCGTEIYEKNARFCVNCKYEFKKQ